MREVRSKLYWGISSAIAVIPALIFSFPNFIEKVMRFLLTEYPMLKKWGSDIDLAQQLLITAVGLLIFIITNIGRFQEYKIHLDSIHFCRRQLNLFKYFSYMSIGYAFSFFVVLYTMLFFTKNSDVLRFFLSLSNLILVCVTFLLCFLIVKVFILEEILDHLQLEEDLKSIMVRFPDEFSK
jgi:hypothetical protein